MLFGGRDAAAVVAAVSSLMKEEEECILHYRGCWLGCQINKWASFVKGVSLGGSLYCWPHVYTGQGWAWEHQHIRDKLKSFRASRPKCCGSSTTRALLEICKQQRAREREKTFR